MHHTALPSIKHSEKLLYPLPIVVVLYIISMLCHFNVVHFLLHYHYGYHGL